MIVNLAFLAITLAAVQGHAIPQSARHGVFNTYHLFSQSLDNGRTPILMPSAEDLQVDYDSTTTTIDSTTVTDPTTTEQSGGGGGVGGDLAESYQTLLLPELSPNLDTIVIVHGHGGDNVSTLNPGIREAYMDKRARPEAEDVNVIVVNWSTFTKQSYSVASAAVQDVGRALGAYLKVLVDQNRISVSRLHLIGFNLGAHVVGFAGRGLGGAAARITGLDPSGSNWGSNSPRLTKSDARYVEVIHTDGSGIGSNGIGTSLGDVDFFVNGGSNQPGCLTHSCSHNRAYELFEATLVRGEDLDGRACNSNLQLSMNLCKGRTLHVGGDDLFKRHGDDNLYRVNTKRAFPY